MMTVNEVSKLTGVSIRTLQYYDKIGLLKPTGYTESGYRLYDDIALEMLQQILLFKELEFPLKEIKEIISRPDSADVQSQVQKLKDYITENFYKCSNEILLSLGEMYAGGGEFTTNIDRVGGTGTAEFTAEAIRIYCNK